MAVVLESEELESAVPGSDDPAESDVTSESESSASDGLDASLESDSAVASSVPETEVSDGDAAFSEEVSSGDAVSAEDAVSAGDAVPGGSVPAGNPLSGVVTESDADSLEFLQSVQETQTLLLESSQRIEVQNEAVISILLIFLIVGLCSYSYRFFKLFF